MKKNIFAACAVAFAAVLFTASCGNSSKSPSKEETQEEKYTNKVDVAGCTIARYAENLGYVNLEGAVLLKGEKEIFRADSIAFDKQHNCFKGIKAQGTSLYFPNSGATFFVLQNYALSPDGSVIVAKKTNDEYDRALWGAYDTTAAEAPAIVKNDNEKIILLESGGFYIPYENGSWLRLDAKGEGVAQMAAAQMKRLKGFDPKAEVQVLK